MLARLFVAVPFHLAVPDGRRFNVYTYEDEGYLVNLYPPSRSDRPAPGDIPDVVKMNGAPAFVANGLGIEFRRESFDRVRGHSWDPPEAVINRAIDSFLTRLRYVTRGAQVHRVPLRQLHWQLRYLNDDGTELEEDSAMIRGLDGIVFHWSLVGINETVWEDIHRLPADFAPPPWDDLLLDSQAALPHVGTGVVLAATALEVFIAQILDALAARSDVPADVWKWLTDRGEWLRDPTTEEQFDVLLRHFTGHSLKEDGVLWEAFKNLKSARNSFVHEGVPKVGGKIVSVTDAARLLARANEIINRIKGWLHAELRWPEFELSVRLEIEHGFPERPNPPMQPTAPQD